MRAVEMRSVSGFCFSISSSLLLSFALSLCVLISYSFSLSLSVSLFLLFHFSPSLSCVLILRNEQVSTTPWDALDDMHVARYLAYYATCIEDERIPQVWGRICKWRCCAYCRLAPLVPNTDGKLTRCAKCPKTDDGAFYCNASCQAGHWASHKAVHLSKENHSPAV
jgi:hypothetical protein